MEAPSDSLIKKAEAELNEYSDQEKQSLLDTLDQTLDAWASENGYLPASCRVGLGKTTQWLAPIGSKSPPYPENDIGLVRNHLLQEEYPLFLEMLKRISKNLEFALAKVYALLILREADCGNLEGAKDASDALDGMYPYILKHARDGHKVNEGRKKGGKNSGALRTLGAKEKEEEIVAMARELLMDGRERRDLASIISKRTGLSPRHIRRTFKKHNI